MHHDTPFAGHRAYDTTIASLLKRYYWNYMPSEVNEYCQTCHACQEFNYSTFNNRAPLQPIDASRPFQITGLDYTGPFSPITLKGNRYIIFGIDQLTKFAIGAATPNCTAQTTAEFVFNDIICKLGMVENFLSDQGSSFEALLFKHLCILLGTNKLRTTTYMAPGNGNTERLNKTIKPAIAKHLDTTKSNWDSFLQMAISAYNNSYHSSIKMTPFEALYNRPAIQVADVIMNNQLPSTTKIADIAEFTKQLKQDANRIGERLRINVELAKAKQKKYYDQFVRSNASYKIGDLVTIENHSKIQGISKSFLPKFNGPYIITKQPRELTYVLQAPNRKDEVVHFNKLHKYKLRKQSVDNLVDEPTKIVLKQTIILQNETEHHFDMFAISRAAIKRKNKAAAATVIQAATLRALRAAARNFRQQEEERQNLLMFEIIEQVANENFVLAPGTENLNWPIRVNVNQLLDPLPLAIGWRNCENNIINIEVDPHEDDNAYETVNMTRDLQVSESLDSIDSDGEENNSMMLLLEHTVANQDIEDLSVLLQNSTLNQNVSNNSYTDANESLPITTPARTGTNAAGKITVPCTICGQMCERQYGLGVHMRIAHPPVLL